MLLACEKNLEYNSRLFFGYRKEKRKRKRWLVLKLKLAGEEVVNWPSKSHCLHYGSINFLKLFVGPNQEGPLATQEVNAVRVGPRWGPMEGDSWKGPSKP